jgi:regulator of protease activity HflC (stomatin/prohibitin superfamily)
MFRTVVIYPGQTGLLYRDGQLDRRLEPGKHSWWDWSGKRTHAVVVPTTPQLIGSYQVEPITADHFSFRMTVAVTAELVDAVAYYETLGSMQREHLSMVGSQLIYGQLVNLVPAAWREAVAKRTLEAFLADAAADLPMVSAALADAMPGARMTSMLITQITMPPEIRKMFTEVERARREGLAQLERARAEQAALRALANAARSLADNPGLERLRVLQAMESAKGSKTFVLGDGHSPGVIARQGGAADAKGDA